VVGGGQRRGVEAGAEANEKASGSAIIQEATGCSWEEADARAVVEAGAPLKPLARAEGVAVEEPKRKRG
jgi:hypothetical protein